MRKEDGTPYNAGKDDWNEARNASLLKEVRVSMLKGEWHPECERCRQEETNGIRSRREWENEDLGPYGQSHGDIDLEKAQAITAKDGTIDTAKQDINFIDIRYGNFCNLKCRMCGPTDSHQWYSDFVEMHKTTSYKDTHDKIQLVKNDVGRWTTDQYDWFQNNEKYWENFEKYATTAHKLYIVGGEPLIIDEHLESIERLVASGNSKNIRLEYNTNLTILPPKLLVLWEQFKEIRIGASIDGIGDVFNYQRTPANFDQVYKNMLKLNQSDKINLRAWFAFTVTPYNVFHFPEFMKWKLTESNLTRFNTVTDSRPVVSHHMCHSPKYYNIKVLPAGLKQQVVDHYNTYINWVTESDQPANVKKEFVKILRGVIKFMNSEDYSERWLGEFVSHTNKLDTLREQDIRTIVPQYKELFDATR